MTARIDMTNHLADIPKNAHLDAAMDASRDAPKDAPAIDKAALMAKYLQERDKRLRPDGNAQYLQVTGRLAHYLDDPYLPRQERVPKTDHVRFAFIGGGFAGLVTDILLQP